MIELLIMFCSYSIKIVKWYLFTILPLLILISVICVLVGMCIRSGLKGGMAIGILLLTMIIFIFVIYGKDAVKIFSKIKDKLTNTYFSGKAIFGSSSSQESSSQENK